MWHSQGRAGGTLIKNKVLIVPRTTTIVLQGAHSSSDFRFSTAIIPGGVQRGLLVSKRFI